MLRPLAVLVLTAAVHAQPPTPATQPARPPDRPPTGEPRPVPAPEPDLGGDRERARPDAVRPQTPEAGDSGLRSLTLTGCLERAGARAWRLRPIAGDDATVTEDVRVAGDVESLRAHVGQRVELQGTYEQATPARQPATFAVDRVRVVGGECRASR